MKTKKLLSLLLALMMMLSVVPFYASAAPIALTASNITINPIAEGTIYYGQTVEEAILLTGGEVQYDGIVVPGSFVHTDPTFRPLGAGADRATRTSFTFVPSDSTTYSSIAVRNSRDVTYVVLPTTPVLADENDKPIVTEQVEAGTPLSNIAIYGGKVQNPYYPEETTYLSQTWTWVDPTINVDESGYYEAKIVGDDKKYSDFVYSIYIEVLGSITVPEIEAPTMELVYNSTRIWADINLDSCKAFVSNEDGSNTEIEGSFSVADAWKDKGAYLGSHQINVIFTPTDVETYAVVEFKLNVNINPIPISFGEDHKGTSIDDPFVYEAEPGTLMRDVQSYLMAYLNYPPQSIISVEDKNNAAENGRVYKLTVQHDNPNYVGSEAYVKTVFKTVELTPTFKPGYLSSAIDCGDYRPQGTFTVTLDGKEIATVKANEEFTYTVENSGEYVLGAKYNPVENDYFIVADATQTVDVKLERLVNRINCTSNGGLTVLYGDTVELSANATIETLDRWVITDASGNEVDLGIDLTQLKITFEMPDFNITAEAKLKGASSGDDTDEPSGGLDDIFGDLTEGDSDSPIVNIFNNILAWFRNLIETIKSFFRGIGDRT